MRETRADTQQAVVLAIVLHVVLFALMFAGMWWTRSNAPQSAAGAPVEADLVDANALSAAMQRVLEDRPDAAMPQLPEPEPDDEPVEQSPVPPPPPQPLPVPVPEDSPTPPQSKPQDFIPKPDTVEQAEVVATPTPTPSDEKKLQEEKRRQAQVDLTEERERQQESERKRRLAEQAKVEAQEAKAEEERQKKLAEIQREREKAAREAKLAEQKLKQIADAQALAAASRNAENAGASNASPPAGNNGRDAGLEGQYATALQQAIRSKWTRPETVPLGTKCTIVIKQLRGGEVTSVNVSSPCAYDEQGRRSIEAAVLKAQPLPYAGFESVFNRTLILNFEARDR